ncbi:MAG: hypothetical protein NW200_15215 [Hyphomonadaceae bacterium]|nr:hypothetical protein [Hyphomonadaceae bacterium]
MTIWIVPGVLGLLGLLLFLRGVTSLGRTPMSGMFGALSGGAFMALGAAVGLLGLNFLTYNRLSHEQQVAEVTFRQSGPSAFVADMKLPDGATQTCALPDGSTGACNILGDEWQIDARVLKWKPWANVAGLDANYRLERMAGRYTDINAERSAPRSVYQLNENPGLDLWAIARQYGKYAPVVDAQYGSATYIPMADGATYYVTMSQTGLLARPANDAARAAVTGWK